MKFENGLVLNVPAEGFQIDNTATGVRIRPSNWRSLRESVDMTLDIRDSVPEGDFSSTRKLDNGEARYRIDSVSGGSGGEERTLHAYVPASGRYLYLQQTTQSEDPSHADFAPAWRVLGSARLEK